MDFIQTLRNAGLYKGIMVTQLWPGGEYILGFFERKLTSSQVTACTKFQTTHYPIN